jgi:hypothetical protein
VVFDKLDGLYGSLNNLIVFTSNIRPLPVDLTRMLNFAYDVGDLRNKEFPSGVDSLPSYIRASRELVLAERVKERCNLYHDNSREEWLVSYFDRVKKFCDVEIFQLEQHFIL